MNIRNVLRTYSLLRQLTDDESALLETLRGLNDAERESLVVALQPEKTMTKRASKKSASKTNIPLCGACGYAESSIVHKDESRSNFHLFYPPSKSASKSSRASGMAATLAKNLGRRHQCVAMVDDNGGEMPCGEAEDNPIHDSAMGYAGYHEFQSSAVAHEAGVGG